jgi:ATP-dependent DNA helicase DinG
VPAFNSSISAGTRRQKPGVKEKDFTQHFTNMVAELVLASQGRAMVLYTSYAALEASARNLRKMLAPEGIQVLVQGEGESRESLLNRLKEGGRSVLLGTSSFWEGVDVRGEALSLLIIAKLPFAVFTDPIVQGRCDLLELEGKDSFLHFSVPNAILRLRQGFGRLIRSKSDRGVVVLADKRVLTKRYGPAFLRALPAQAKTITSQDALTSAVRDFLANPGNAVE